MAEEISTKEVSGASGSSKKSNTVLIIVLVVLVVLGVGGYLVSRFIIRKVADKAVSSIVSSATGGKVDVNSSDGGVNVSSGDSSLKVGGSATWPSDMPAPKYSDGKIELASKTGTGANQYWMVTVSGTTKGQYDAYLKSVTAAGWTSDSTAEFGATVSSFSKDNYELTATFDPSSNGVSLTVASKQ